jgi:hypothetical protein
MPDDVMAHEGLWEQLEKLSGIETARRANCPYFGDPERYVVPLLNAQYIVRLSQRTILSAPPESPQKPAGFIEQLCLLAYLINARDVPLAGKLCKVEMLPGGQFFFRGPHSLPVEKLQTTFGSRCDSLYAASQRLGAVRCEFGDASIRLHVLPRLPLTIVLWGRCEEFDARASILFDKTAADQLPLDALMAAVNLTVKALTETTPANG